MSSPAPHHHHHHAKLIKSQIVHYDLNITSDFVAPDCVEKISLLVNGGFTGPQIDVNRNDILEVTINNMLDTHGITIHFHGIDQLGTPFYDGAAFVSQDLIPPGRSQTIRMNSQAVFGALVVHEPSDPATIGFDDERTNILRDWWQADEQDLMDGLLSKTHFRWIGDPQSLLTNGRGAFRKAANCSINPASGITPATQTRYQQEFTTITVEPSKTYRFRIIAASTLEYFVFTVPNHTLTIVEVEGTLVEPFTVDALEINSGQRWSDPGTPAGFSILHYSSAKNVTAPSPPSTPLSPLANPTPGWILSKLVPRDLKRAAVPKATQQIILAGHQFLAGDDGRPAVTPFGPGRMLWGFKNQSTAILMHDYANTLKSLPKASQPIAEIKLGEVVEIVLQGTVMEIFPGFNLCQEHPWHLHGHSFYDLGGGPGLYDPKGNHSEPTTAILRDTTTLYPYSGAGFQPQLPAGTPCGWHRIRYVANNPGAWLFHCHIAPHLVMGMGVVFNEGIEHLPPLPVSFEQPF
ncbi:Cupredoxin [Blyttiomyces helicus]|uniref:Cupredoxin n=1 Tax=Blyttiomyces helicus TaxID=388810 RepID=A0A4P9WES9_9FUNG|nr:Cupredoxin [Blyttiomyces helicus]|eukprot:RKO90305.1 Cupredoxin [Blyttiomyces helicus]